NVFSFTKKGVALIAIVAVVLINIIWIWWTGHYNNDLHPNGLFLSTILPAWKLPWATFIDTVSDISLHNFNVYSLPVNIYLIIPGMIFFFIYRRKAGQIFTPLILFMFLGSVAYCILFFNNFLVHDYYIISVYSFTVVLLCGIFQVIKNGFPGLFYSKYFRA